MYEKGFCQETLTKSSQEKLTNNDYVKASSLQHFVLCITKKGAETEKGRIRQSEEGKN